MYTHTHMYTHIHIYIHVHTHTYTYTVHTYIQVQYIYKQYMYHAVKVTGTIKYQSSVHPTFFTSRPHTPPDKTCIIIHKYIPSHQ